MIKKESKPVFKLTKKQFELRNFKDKKRYPVQIGDHLKNDYEVEFIVNYNKRCDEVTLSGYAYDTCNLNSIYFLRRI